MKTFFILNLFLQPMKVLEKEKTVWAKRTTIYFADGDLIEGKLWAPDIGYIEARKRIRFDNLIKYRTNFRKKVLNSINYL